MVHACNCATMAVLFYGSHESHDCLRLCTYLLPEDITNYLQKYLWSLFLRFWLALQGGRGKRGPELSLGIAGSLRVFSVVRAGSALGGRKGGKGRGNGREGGREEGGMGGRERGREGERERGREESGEGEGERGREGREGRREEGQESHSK